MVRLNLQETEIFGVHLWHLVYGRWILFACRNNNNNNVLNTDLINGRSIGILPGIGYTLYNNRPAKYRWVKIKWKQKIGLSVPWPLWNIDPVIKLVKDVYANIKSLLFFSDLGSYGLVQGLFSRPVNGRPACLVSVFYHMRRSSTVTIFLHSSVCFLER